jgi:hypothetical protein
MSLTSDEVAFLTRQPRGYLTTLGPEIIRIRPARVVSFNISPDQPGMRARQIP